MTDLMPFPGPPPAGVGVTRIISGGQAGADRGGLEAAIELGIEHAGWCPAGRRAEDGLIPAHYRLRETDSRKYDDRTLRNLVIADATLVFTWGPPGKGSSLTIASCHRFGKPVLHLDLYEIRKCHGNQEPTITAVVEFLGLHDPRTINVAGSRQSRSGTMDNVERIVTNVMVHALKRHRNNSLRKQERER